MPHLMEPQCCREEDDRRIGDAVEGMLAGIEGRGEAAPAARLGQRMLPVDHAGGQAEWKPTG